VLRIGVENPSVNDFMADLPGIEDQTPKIKVGREDSIKVFEWISEPENNGQDVLVLSLGMVEKPADEGPGKDTMEDDIDNDPDIF
jgi:hypothetical protein